MNIFVVSFILFICITVGAGSNSVRYLKFHYEAEVVARYGRTRITSVVKNDADDSQLLEFDLKLPDTAFIANFSMQVGERRFNGIAKKKLEALQEFINRTKMGENVGLVQQIETNTFRVSMNTAANETSTFTLQYEELLRRERSFYSKVLTINPGAVVDDLLATIRVKEPEGLSTYSTSDFATIDEVSSNEILCHYQATVDVQRSFSSSGLSMDMTCEYDVIHPTDGAGNFAINSGYFAQFFSPVITNTLRISLVLVIDVSGSMQGDKISQARDSLVALLGQLHNDDYVAMVTFESSVDEWRSTLVRVGTYRTEAVSYSRSLNAGGGTNLDGGLQTGINILKETEIESNAKLLVLLTDGLPSSGITDNERIISRAIDATVGTGISVNCISFGYDADFEFLQDLALTNFGIAIRIAVDTNAGEELTGFLREISTPSLAEVEVVFPVGSVEEVTAVEFPFLFSGSEIVVAGKFTDSSPENITVQVTGQGVDNTVTYESFVSTVTDTTIAGSLPSTERLWAYLEIKGLLDAKRRAEINGQNGSRFEEKALQLSLSYNFVTELTSLIVVEENANVTIDDGNDQDDARYYNCPSCSNEGVFVAFADGGSNKWIIIIIIIIFLMLSCCGCMIVFCCCCIQREGHYQYEKLCAYPRSSIAAFVILGVITVGISLLIWYIYLKCQNNEKDSSVAVSYQRREVPSVFNKLAECDDTVHVATSPTESIQVSSDKVSDSVITDETDKRLQILTPYTAVSTEDIKYDKMEELPTSERICTNDDAFTPYAEIC